VHAVLVFMFDRWGRDGAEWLTRVREFERLRVPIISVQEGRDEGGLIRFIRAGMAEEYSRQLAKRVRPARERAARAGTHMGTTPIGYKRVYPAYESSRHRPPAELVVDETTAWIVREMYRRYAEGGWSTRKMAQWLNTDPSVGPTPAGKPWRGTNVRWILGNPTYKGCVRFNRQSEGIYERAAPDEVFVVQGRHEALVSPELWDTVQERMQAARSRQTYNITRTQGGNRVLLGSGILRCAVCGAGIYVHRHHVPEGITPLYCCVGRTVGRTCTMKEYSAPVADAALLAEVRRLRGAPWTPQAERRLLGSDAQKDASTAAATARALEAERERLRKHTRLMSMMENDPTEEQVATFREISAEISARIRALESKLATTAQRAAHVPNLQRLHQQLTETELAAVVDGLAAADDHEGLRALVLGLIASATLVEKRPEKHMKWARVAVTWTPDVQVLLDAGLLWLDEPPPAPEFLTGAARRRERDRRRYAVKRARRQQQSVVERLP
jgi:hypothetical protein